MRLEYRLEAEWPPGAWIAECRSGRATVRHGRRVETRAEWFCEAAWDGPFDRGDFDRTDIVAGSGGRLRGGELVFVPAGATVDRLQSITVAAGAGGDRVTFVSNSLACLVATAGARLNPTYRFYRRDIQSVVRGITRYKKFLETSVAPVRLWYYHNVAWDGNALREIEKPDPMRDFGSFEPYRRFLDETLGRVVRNAQDAGRAHPLGLIGTMSSGYDSTAVATLGRAHGLEEVITFDSARGGDPDSGAEAARHLGLRAIVVRREAWRERGPMPEVPFICADGHGEDRFFGGAADHLGGKLMLTGFHGDKIWGKNPYHADSLLPNPEIKRGDPSGLTMTEFRLSAGFINCAVPFWGARRIHEVVAISRSAEMKPWDVPGDYSRPICRRIAESAGVPREAFGTAKRAGSMTERALTEASREDYLAWLRRRGIEGVTLDRVVRRSLKVVPDPVRRRLFQMFYGPRTPSFRDYFFQWAIERRGDVYRSRDGAGDSAPAAPTRPGVRPARRDSGRFAVTA